MASVYVVYTWRDYRKENDADILGVYTDYERSKADLRTFAEEFAKDHDGELEQFEDGYNVIQGGPDYQVFEVKEMPLITEKMLTGPTS